MMKNEKIFDTVWRVSKLLIYATLGWSNWGQKNHRTFSIRDVKTKQRNSSHINRSESNPISYCSLGQYWLVIEYDDLVNTGLKDDTSYNGSDYIHTIGWKRIRFRLDWPLSMVMDQCVWLQPTIPQVHTSQTARVAAAFFLFALKGRTTFASHNDLRF